MYNCVKCVYICVIVGLILIGKCWFKTSGRCSLKGGGVCNPCNIVGETSYRKRGKDTSIKYREVNVI